MKMIPFCMSCLIVLLSACSLTKPIDEVKQWRLMPVRSGEFRSPQSPVWLTQGNMSVVSPFDTKSWVFMVDHERFRKDYYNEFVSIPGEMIATATREWIERANIFQFVNPNTNSLFPNYVLQGTVEELFIDIRSEPKVVIRITYLLTTNGNSNNPVIFRKTYASSAPISKALDSKEILQAQSTALSTILTQLEQDLFDASKNMSNSTGNVKK